MLIKHYQNMHNRLFFFHFLFPFHSLFSAYCKVWVTEVNLIITLRTW